MRTGTGRFGISGRRDGSGDLRRADIYSDEALWRARYEAAVAEARFWKNFAWLKPFAVSTSTRVVELRPMPPRKVVPVPEVVIPVQRSRPDHPAVAALTERVLQNLNNRGGRA